MRHVDPMVTPALFLLAILSLGQPTNEAAVDLGPDPAASAEWLSPHDAERDLIPCEAIAEDLEEDGEEEALPCDSWRAIEESRPPADRSDSQQSPLHPSTVGRHRPL